jgi:lipid A 3-O-deacylase
LNSASEIRTGTLNDKISGGFNFMFGEFSDPYMPSSRQKTRKKRFSYYLYGQPVASLIGYDASLEGGVFDHKSPYTIAPAGISRLTFQADYGIVVCVSTLYLEYCQSYLTKEFESGHYHRWGGIRIGFTF